MSSNNIADPAPLGLAAFGYSTVLLNVINAGLVGTGLEGSFVLTMGLFFGGLGQLIAGYWAFKLGELFPATAFSGYGAFWESFAFWLLFNQMENISIPTPSGAGIAWYMVLWGIFTFLLWINSFYHNWNLVGVFTTLWLLFFLLGAHFALASTLILRIAGGVGILCGSWAIWTSFCIIYLDHSGIKLPGMSTPFKRS
ncbi:MAG: transcriptional regulator [Candidatus Korarchaeota archaeon]|nr:transcriptional regulator [Candidatus Korarchaeota archaeon]NIU84581.1 transcriptional regulator [Candidatus Thorarchaeota archaeon]NIW14639.1 transcriptional regulator [Candidatus Thorarchaeota archaeon]NIW52716.1 transcriptional regulator [Candidatus Korarchaeota archaeon]